MPPSKDQPNILRAPGDYEVTPTIHNDTYAAIDPLKHDLSGLAVFVTGASRGIGRAIALSFAKAGASYIAVGARSDCGSLASEIQAVAPAGREEPVFLPLVLDVTDEASVAHAAGEVESRFGRLHVLVNNAGILGRYGLVADSDPVQWMRVMDVNLQGPYRITRAFLPLLLASASAGRQKFIVNVCSAGAHLTNPTLSAYQVSKAALLKFSTLTDVEYAAKGISTLAIHPGNVPTDIMGGPEAIPDHHKHVFVETPELGADSIVYLVSQDSQWLGGRYVNCTWDMPALFSQKDRIVAGNKLKTKLDF